MMRRLWGERTEKGEALSRWECCWLAWCWRGGLVRSRWIRQWTTIERFEAAGSPVVTDGEQRKYHNFPTYCVHGLPNTAPDGFKIAFSDGHTRRLSRLTRGPFRYRRYADSTHSGDMGYDARLRRRGAGAGQSCRRFPLCQ